MCNNTTDDLSKMFATFIPNFDMNMCKNMIDKMVPFKNFYVSNGYFLKHTLLHLSQKISNELKR